MNWVDSRIWGTISAIKQKSFIGRFFQVFLDVEVSSRNFHSCSGFAHINHLMAGENNASLAKYI